MGAESCIRPVLPGDAAALAVAMRPADAAEVAAAHGLDGLEALTSSLEASEVSFAVELAGELAGLGGVRPGDGFGVVWLLTGTAVDRHRRAFLRESRRVLGLLVQHYQVLVNMVDARYAAALRWAAWLGAEVQPAEPWGVAGLPFHRVIWRSPWVQR